MRSVVSEVHRKVESFRTGPAKRRGARDSMTRIRPHPARDRDDDQIALVGLSRMVSRILASWNQLRPVLLRIQALRQIA